MKSLKDCYTLSNGVKIPCLGFGTWRLSDEDSCEAVKNAVSAGYRHIDAAAFYQNQVGVGRGIRECGVPREELFVTSKVWNSHQGYDATMADFEKTM